jgi:hypothetical protein
VLRWLDGVPLLWFFYRLSEPETISFLQFLISSLFYVMRETKELLFASSAFFIHRLPNHRLRRGVSVGVS